MLLLEGHVTLLCTDGEVIVLDTRCSGVKEGYAFIGNPYWHNEPYWRFKDGDTCIGCSADWASLPVADAYQELNRRFAKENAEITAELDRMDAMDEEKRALREWERTTGRLYAIQDALCGV